MKNFIISLLALLSFTLGARASEPTDTVGSFTGLSTIVITDSPEGLKVTDTDTLTGTSRLIYSRAYSPNSTVTSTQERPRNRSLTLIPLKTSSRFGIHTGGLSLGLVNALGQPAGFGLQWEKSFEISWLEILGVYYRTRFVDISLGVGYTWRNFRTTGQNSLILDNDGNISTIPYPSGVQPKFSSLKTEAVNFPLLFHIYPNRRLCLTLGPVLNLRTYSSILTKYNAFTDNDCIEMETKVNRGINVRKVSMDLYCSLVYSDFGLYARYSPQSLLKSPFTPSFQPLSVGVTVGF